MARFNALVFAGSIGAILGTAMHPGVLEIAIVAAALIGGFAAIKTVGRKYAATSA